MARFDARHIYGTLVVNLTGTFAAGLIGGAIEAEDPTRLLVTGLLGGYTTFSTWVFETHRLAEAGERRLAAANIAASLALGLLAAWAGLRLGDSLWGQTS